MRISCFIYSANQLLSSLSEAVSSPKGEDSTDRRSVRRSVGETVHCWSSASSALLWADHRRIFSFHRAKRRWNRSPPDLSGEL